MKLLKSLIIFCCLIVTSKAFAIDYQVKGTVVDSLGEGEMYATIRIFNDIDSIKPIKGEYQVVKQRWSAFYNTELDMILRRLGVKQVVLAGVQTPNCIRGTVWDANSLDYEVIVLTDSTNAKTPEVHQANLFDMKNIGIKMMTTQEYCDILAADPEGPEATFQERIRAEIESSGIAPEPRDIYNGVQY